MMMSCAIGKFVFEEGTILSHAKLIRDSLMGQILSPEPGTPRIHSEQNCYDYVRNECGQQLAATRFVVALS